MYGYETAIQYIYRIMSHSTRPD